MRKNLINLCVLLLFTSLAQAQLESHSLPMQFGGKGTAYACAMPWQNDSLIIVTSEFTQNHSDDCLEMTIDHGLYVFSDQTLDTVLMFGQDGEDLITDLGKLGKHLFILSEANRSCSAISESDTWVYRYDANQLLRHKIPGLNPSSMVVMDTILVVAGTLEGSLFLGAFSTDLHLIQSITLPFMCYDNGSSAGNAGDFKLYKANGRIYFRVRKNRFQALIVSADSKFAIKEELLLSDSVLCIDFWPDSLGNLTILEAKRKNENFEVALVSYSSGLPTTLWKETWTNLIAVTLSCSGTTSYFSHVLSSTVVEVVIVEADGQSRSTKVQLPNHLFMIPEIIFINGIPHLKGHLNDYYFKNGNSCLLLRPIGS